MDSSDSLRISYRYDNISFLIYLRKIVGNCPHWTCTPVLLVILLWYHQFGFLVVESTLVEHFFVPYSSAVSMLFAGWILFISISRSLSICLSIYSLIWCNIFWFWFGIVVFAFNIQEIYNLIISSQYDLLTID